jgi:hypothetical protein
MRAGIGVQPRRGGEHDRREQHDRRVEAQDGGGPGGGEEHHRQQAAGLAPGAEGHRRAQRVEQAGAPAAVGEHQQRGQESDRGTERVQGRACAVKAQRPDEHDQQRGTGGDRPVRCPAPAHDRRGQARRQRDQR